MWGYDSVLSVGAWSLALVHHDRFDAIDREINEQAEDTHFDQVKMNKLGIEQAQLEPIHELVGRIKSIRSEYTDLLQLQADSQSTIDSFAKQARSHDLSVRDAASASASSSSRSDAEEMSRLAKDDLSSLLPELHALETRLVDHLLPSTIDDVRGALLEVRAGVGGDEAAIFARELFEMYEKFSHHRGWTFEIMETLMNESSGVQVGYKSASAKVSGGFADDDVFGRLRHESGTHRVQRVPSTEAKGRLHTSAATVIVLPQVADEDIDIHEKDIKVDVFRSSGKGGQSVNTTDSAVRLTHLPTGIQVSMQDERSQFRNKDKAMIILKSRIYQAHRQKQMNAQRQTRSEAATGGDRSDRIRTYNWPQQRVTDHRLGLQKHGIQAMLSGEMIDEFINKCKEKERVQQIQMLNAE